MIPFPKPLYKNSQYFQEFWNNGNGKKLIEWTNAAVSFKKKKKNATNYYLVDELGDEVVKEIYFKNSFPEAQKIINSH